MGRRGTHSRNRDPRAARRPRHRPPGLAVSPRLARTRPASSLRTLLLGLALCVFGGQASGSDGNHVDLLLVFAIDASGSTDGGAFATQIEGHAAAFRSPDVVEAIRSGPLGRIAVAAIVWSDDAVQLRCVNWMLIANASDAERFARALLGSCRFIGGGTSLAGAIRSGMSELGWSPYISKRRVIDISGNDPQPLPWLDATRQRAINAGVTINGLAIEATPSETGPAEPTEDALTFFRANVIGGPGAFALSATAETFAVALIKKLVIETVSLGRG